MNIVGGCNLFDVFYVQHYKSFPRHICVLRDTVIRKNCKEVMKGRIVGLG